MPSPSIVGISGSLSNPSRTSALVAAVLATIEKRSGYSTRRLEVSAAVSALFAATSSLDAGKEARDLLELVESADLLVIGTPVYRASYSGAFKHLFDLVDHRRFAGKPVVLTATGGSPLHGLVIEHQLRPLFGFLNALTLPTSIYATETDFQNYSVANPRIDERIERVVEEALRQLSLIHVPAGRPVPSAANVA